MHYFGRVQITRSIVGDEVYQQAHLFRTLRVRRDSGRGGEGQDRWDTIVLPHLSHRDFTSRTAAVGLLRFERSHIDGETVLHIRLEQSVVGFVGFLDGDDFDIGSDVMGPAKIEHLLGFGDTANG